MDKKIKTKWLRALRSGKFKQANGVLLERETGAMCCLGVLCHIQGADTGFMVKNFLEIDLGQYNAGLSPDDREILANRNDGIAPLKRRQSFKQIANYIEKNL